MAAGVVTLILLFAGPMVLVWKQAYIAGVSMRVEAMTDTVLALSRQITALHLVCDRMTCNERIEAFARNVLRLDYPSSDRIVIVPIEEINKKRGVAAEVAQLLSVVQDRRNEKGVRE